MVVRPNLRNTGLYVSCLKSNFQEPSEFFAIFLLLFQHEAMCPFPGRQNVNSGPSHSNLSPTLKKNMRVYLQLHIFYLYLTRKLGSLNFRQNLTRKELEFFFTRLDQYSQFENLTKESLMCRNHIEKFLGMRDACSFFVLYLIKHCCPFCLRLISKQKFLFRFKKRRLLLIQLLLTEGLAFWQVLDDCQTLTNQVLWSLSSYLFFVYKF